MSSQQLASFTIPGGNFGYTGAAVDDLTSFSNCIALSLLDESGSTRSFAPLMEAAMNKVTKFLRKSPEADKIIWGHWQFDTNLREAMGLTPLPQVPDDQFDGCWAGGGRTALYFGETRMHEIMRDYAKQQAEKRYTCNGILITMTDGYNYTVNGDPGHSFNEETAKKAFAETVINEDLESLTSILIGINSDKHVQENLKQHADEVGYTRYLPVEEADEATLAKIANFISMSIQTQSQSVGTGGPSQKIASLTF